MLVAWKAAARFEGSKDPMDILRRPIEVQVTEHRWGTDVEALQPQPDLITCADVVYQPEYFEDLAASIAALSAPHTVTYVSFRHRGVPGLLF